jgi:uroporphyrinogen III methyltransferase/synthase
MNGMVYFVGAGPGDPELLTVKGERCIARADLVLYDYLVDERILTLAKQDAELVSLGESHSGRKLLQDEVNEQMIAAAQKGRIVVRLKGGDPHIFGRLNEEIDALKNAGIQFEVVPGITAASAAAQAAGISLTNRQNSSAIVLLTGHPANKNNPNTPALDFKKFANFVGNLIFYMGVETVQTWSNELLDGGMLPETPVLIVQNATRRNQKIIHTTLINTEKKIKEENIQKPAVIIVGKIS